MSYGQTFQLIRKGKGFTLKEAVGNTISISQLSRFENNQSMIPVDLFHELLQNVNTTPQEFHFLMDNDFEKNLRDAFIKLATYTETGDKESLKQMKEQLKLEDLKPYSWKQFLVYFIDEIIEVQKRENSIKNTAVKDYLMQVEDWGEMELRIYALFGFSFDVDTTYFLMKTALKKASSIARFHKTCNYYILF